ncbi:MAG TPA: VWA domain-containing protein [Nannocystis sp.]
MALTACLEHPIKKVLYDKVSEAEKNVAIAINKDVDILFVIDNSGSMADEQELLSANFKSFIDVLEAPDVNANYRIGITTTDSGNPRCPSADTTPEGGKLVLSSCVDRALAGEFTLEQQNEDYSDACYNFCNLDDSQLTAKMKPTETQYSKGEKKPRKWIERIEGETNLPDGVTTIQAFQCFGPQGVSGCGFESHLESMYLALAQASSEKSETNYGFLRDAAILSIVFLTDEVDCSYKNEYKEIFTTNKVFWEDPNNGVVSTSAVCWNAGVKCEGAGPKYERCWATNYDITGKPDVPDDQAVLQPLSKYINFVQNIENQKKMYDPNQEVLVALIAGVPPGYEDGSADIIYEDSSDPMFQEDFGIGPGCTYTPMGATSPQTALPPVREREFAEHFQVGDKRNLFSICQNDYSKALEAIATRIRDQIKPACMPNCVKDTDPSTEVLEPSCQLFEENLALGTRNQIEECQEVNGQWVAPAGATVCFAMLIDKEGLTPSKIDDMSEECVAEGYNLEFLLIRSGAAPAGTTISAACELSPNKGRDCPDL